MWYDKLESGEQVLITCGIEEAVYIIIKGKDNIIICGGESFTLTGPCEYSYRCTLLDQYPEF